MLHTHPVPSACGHLDSLLTPIHSIIFGTSCGRGDADVDSLCRQVDSRELGEGKDWQLQSGENCQKDCQAAARMLVKVAWAGTQGSNVQFICP